MARKKTALGQCSKWAAEHGLTKGKRKKYIRECTQRVAANERARNLGYAPPRGGSPQYTWKRKKR